ncbi:hypothetical protein ES703_19327 [subsurface metagenome]
MLVYVSLGLAEADAVDDRGMIELVGDDGVFSSDKGFKDSAIGVKTGYIEDGIFGLEELGYLLL